MARAYADKRELASPSAVQLPQRSPLQDVPDVTPTLHLAAPGLVHASGATPAGPPTTVQRSPLERLRARRVDAAEGEDTRAESPVKDREHSQAALVRRFVARRSSGGAKRPRRGQRPFMEQARKTISAEGHPLGFLLDPESGRWASRQKYAQTPTVQAGHLVSHHFGEPERLALEDSTFNQWSSNRGESQGAVFFKSAIDVGGVPVEYRTAREWETQKLLERGTVGSRPDHRGWSIDDMEPAQSSAAESSVAESSAAESSASEATPRARKGKNTKRP